MALKVGVQLYSVKKSLAKDPAATFRFISEAGFRYIELANFQADQAVNCGFDMDTNLLLDLTKEMGLILTGSQVIPLNLENIRDVVDFHQKISAQTIVFCSSGYYTGRDDVLRRCEEYNALGKICAQEGLSLCYHNQFQEFQTDGGKSYIEHILQNTDPAYVNLEIDTYWIYRGGTDPVRFMEENGDRIRLIHHKDFSKHAKSPANILAATSYCYKEESQFEGMNDPLDFVEVGEGVLDTQKIIDAGIAHCRSEYFLLDQDDTQLGEEKSIQVNFENMMKFHGLIR